MGYGVTLVPGDGIGPEVTSAAGAVVEAAGVRVEWEPFATGAVLAAGRVQTRDLGGSATTTEFTHEVTRPLASA